MQMPEGIEVPVAGRLLMRLSELNLTQEQQKILFEILEINTITDGDEIVGFQWPEGDCYGSMTYGDA